MLEAEKAALLATATENAATLDEKKAAQLKLAEQRLRSMQSPRHKTLGTCQNSQPASPLAPAAPEAGKTVAAAETEAAILSAESSPDKRCIRFEHFEGRVVQQAEMPWGGLTVEDMKRFHPREWKALTDRNTDTRHRRSQCRARYLRKAQVLRVHALEAQIRQLQEVQLAQT